MAAVIAYIILSMMYLTRGVLAHIYVSNMTVETTLFQHDVHSIF